MTSLTESNDWQSKIPAMNPEFSCTKDFAQANHVEIAMDT